MHTLILSAFSDEYAEELEKQCEALVRFGIKNMEIRRADGKNVSEFTECEAKRIRKTLDAFGIGVSAVGSPLGRQFRCGGKFYSFAVPLLCISRKGSRSAGGNLYGIECKCAGFGANARVVAG